MSERTSRFGLAYPSEHQDPWWSDFESLVSGLDGELFALHEARGLVASGGGTIAWNASTGMLSWDAPMVFVSPTTSVRMTLGAGSVGPIADGQIAAMSVVRGPVAESALSVSVSQSLPVDGGEMLFARRFGALLVLWNGLSLDDGDTLQGVGLGQGSGLVAPHDHPDGIHVINAGGRVWLDDGLEVKFGTSDTHGVSYNQSGGRVAGGALDVRYTDQSRPVQFRGAVEFMDGAQALVSVGNDPVVTFAVTQEPGGSSQGMMGVAVGEPGGLPIFGTAVSYKSFAVGAASDQFGSKYVGFVADSPSMNGSPAFPVAFWSKPGNAVALDAEGGDVYVHAGAGLLLEDLGAKSWPGGQGGYLYVRKDVDGLVDLYYANEVGAERRLTMGGGVLVPSARYSVGGYVVVANTDGVRVAGMTMLDGSQMSREGSGLVYFEVSGYVSAGRTGTVELRNVTDNESVATLTLTASVPETVRQALTLGSAVGNVKLSQKVYEVRVSVDGSTASDLVVCGVSYVEVSP